MVLLPSPPTAVLIHGAGGGGWEYEKWKPVFERAGWRVVNRDLLPANGALKATKLKDYVRQVVGWCPKSGRFILVGASMGGRLALEAAALVKPSVVVLVNGVPPSGTGGKKFPPVVQWANGPLKDTRDSMPDSDEKTILWAWKKWRNESGAVMADLSKGGTVKRPECPVLVVIGEKDTDVLPAKSRAVAVRFGAKVLSYPNMSHVGPLLGTRAEQVAEDVLAKVLELAPALK